MLQGLPVFFFGFVYITPYQSINELKGSQEFTTTSSFIKKILLKGKFIFLISKWEKRNEKKNKKLQVQEKEEEEATYCIYGIKMSNKVPIG